MTIELLSVRAQDLDGNLGFQVYRLLRDAFPDDGPNEGDYYRAVSTPDTILILRDADGVFAHLGVYLRTVAIGDATEEIGMLGGIAVAPERRRAGHARRLIESAHDILRQRGVTFSVLFAVEPRLYVSSGYRLMQNETRFIEPDGTPRTLVYRGSMFAELGARKWPNLLLDLRGKTF